LQSVFVISVTPVDKKQNPFVAHVHFSTQNNISSTVIEILQKVINALSSKQFKILGLALRGGSPEAVGSSIFYEFITQKIQKSRNCHRKKA